jgi:hypothetical protein
MSSDLLPFEGSRVQDEVRRSSDRAFGRVFGVIFALIGLLPLVDGEMPRWWALAFAVAFVVISVFSPHWLGTLNHGWFRLGVLLHAIVSPLVMAAIFFILVTPIALLRRMTGRDALGLRFVPEAKSYWVPREPPGPEPESLRNQY